MNDLITRRKLITTGLAAAAGFVGVETAALIADRFGLLPPDHQGLFGLGETLTYASQRILMSGHSLAREFSPSDISKVAPINGKPPQSDDYSRLAAGQFSEWRLLVDGLVSRPRSFSMAELKSFPARQQITHQACEEGWSFIAQWIGVPLAYVLNLVGVSERAKWVVYYSIQDDWWDSMDLPDAMHPQTFLAYGFNGRDLTIERGAPVRMRVARQLGQKSVKYLTRISLVDSLKHVRDGLGSGSPSVGFSWYVGI
jgi:DMSO/TMAO reductase YedYZ molybdopterin-dependent catalytic subunit